MTNLVYAWENTVLIYMIRFDLIRKSSWLLTSKVGQLGTHWKQKSILNTDREKQNCFPDINSSTLPIIIQTVNSGIVQKY